MAPENTCQVCGLKNILPGKTECPQCKADLICFKVLDSFPDELVIKGGAPKSQVILGLAIVLLFGVIVGVCVNRIYRFGQVEFEAWNTHYPIGIKIDMEAELRHRAQDDLSMLETELNGLTGSLSRETGKQGNAEKSRGKPGTATPRKGEARRDAPGDTGKADARMKSVQDEAPEPPTPDITPVKPARDEGPKKVERFWTYHAADNDTLWSISKRYYGSGYYYPVLLEQNPGLGVFNVREGMGIKILKDPGEAKKTYGKITARIGIRMYYNYKVAEGDTWQSIAKRFYKKKEMAKRIIALNSHADLRPGERIIIELEY